MTNSSQNSQTFTEETSPRQPRLKVIKLSKGITENFKNAIKKFNVQSIEYKPFLRFHIANQNAGIHQRCLQQGKRSLRRY